MIAPWRAAAGGTPELTAEEAMAAAGLVVLAGASVRRAGLSAFAMAAAAVAVAFVALAASGPEWATSFELGVAVLGLPSAVALASLLARIPDTPAAASSAFARFAIGGAIGVGWVDQAGAAGASWSSVAGIAALLALSASLLALRGVGASAAVRTGDEVDATTRSAMLVGAVFAWAFLGPAGLGDSPVEWPLADSAVWAWLAAALGAATSRGPARSGAARALVVAACVLAAASAAAGSALAAGVSLACAVALMAQCVGGAYRLRAGLGMAIGGASMVLSASWLGATPVLSIGVLAAIAGPGVARRGAAGWLACMVGVAVAVASLFGNGPADAHPQHPRTLAAHGAARVLWLPSTQETALVLHGRECDRHGPGRNHAGLAAAVVALLVGRGPVAVVDDGVGACAEILQECEASPVWRSHPVADVRFVSASARVDGPARVRAPGAPDELLAVAGTRSVALRLEGTPCAAVVDASLIGGAPHRATAEERHAMALAARAAVSCFALDLSPPAVVSDSVCATAAAHPWCGVFLSDSSAVVVGLDRFPDWDVAEANWGSLPLAARWRLHASGIGCVQDLRDALLCIVAPPSEVARDDSALLGSRDESSVEGRLVANLRQLRLWAGANASPLVAARLDARGLNVESWSRADTRLADAVAAAPDSVLLRQELIRLRVRRADHAILGAHKDAPARVAEAAALAARYLPFGCPSAPLQAALALPNRTGEKIRDRRAAAAAAFALDPGFYEVASPLLRGVLEGSERVTPSEDFSRFPDGARLAELSAQDGPLAVLLRTRHGSRAARALVEQWGRRELPPSWITALRELADPFVLQAAAQALAARGGQRELVRIWRSDLPATASILSLVEGPAEQRQALMVAIAGRKDAGSLHALGCGLVDEDEGVRSAAGAALFRSIGDVIDYDPTWPPERLRDAAARLAQLSQRTSR